MVVLGAGASFGATLDHDVPAPLVDGFFASAERLGLLSETFGGLSLRQMEARVKSAGGDVKRAYPNWESYADGTHLELLTKLVEEQLGVPSRNYVGVKVDVERIMGFVEAELLHAHTMRRLRNEPLTTEPLLADTLEAQMQFLICGTLIKATGGVQCPYHSAIARWLAPGDRVISFNYDLLMDDALRARGDWNVDTGYLMPFSKVGVFRGKLGRWRKRRGTSIPPVLLYKPHGSMNWLYARSPYYSMLNRALDGEPGPGYNGMLYCLDRMHVDFERDHPLYEWWGRYEYHDPTGMAFDMYSLIVPPAITKPYRDLETIVGHLWAFMLGDLVRPDTTLYLIGYSMRPADLRSWWLFRKAAKTGAIKNVVVVDPSDDVFERVRDVFEGTHVERGPRGIREFAASLS